MVDFGIFGNYMYVEINHEDLRWIIFGRGTGRVS